MDSSLCGKWKQCSLSLSLFSFLFFSNREELSKKLSLWTNAELWLKLNSHLNSRRAGTIKGFNLCSGFSSFVISCRTCAARSHFKCVYYGPFIVPPNVVFNTFFFLHAASFHEKLKGWQIQPLPPSLNSAPLHEVSGPPRCLGPEP